MKWINALRSLLRANRSYVAARRWQREGLIRTFRRYRVWRRILHTPPIRTAPHSRNTVELHMLCHQLDYLSAIWALKSFYHAAEVFFPLVIHVNGGTKPIVHERLRRHFPDAAVVARGEADKQVEPWLERRGLSRLIEARRASPFMLKLTDFPLLAKGSVVLGIDSDIMFFARPYEILDRCSLLTSGYLVQADPESSYNLTADEARAEFGINLVQKVNTGLLLYPRDLPDMDEFERYLGHTGVARRTGYIEQTLYALHGSQIQRIDLLPEGRYPVDLRSGLPYEGVVARHYAGPSRPLMTTEGMPLVQKAGWFHTVSGGRQ